MKEYLGLGVVFQAVDQGLARSIKFTSNELGGLNNNLEKTQKTSENKQKKGGVLNGLHEGIKLLSISHIGNTLSDIRESIEGTGSSINDTFKKLDTLQTKMTFTFGEKQAQNLNSALMSSMTQFGLIGDEIENIAHGMVGFGRSVDEIRGSMPMIGTLVGKLGLDSQKVTDMYAQGLASLRATPKALDGVIKEVVGIQKAYNLTDQVSQLPEIFDAVTKNSAMFGKVNTQTALNTVRSISGLSAVFQKVGMSQQGALKAATGFSDKLSSLKRSVSDMRAGLDPLDQDLYEAARTFTMMGISGNDAFEKIFKGADDPMALAKELNSKFLQLSKSQQDIVSARFRRVFGDEATNMLASYGDKAKEAFSIDKKKPETQKKADNEKVFNDLAKSMSGTFAVQEKLTDASKQYFELVTQFANKSSAIEALNAQRNAWNSLTKSVADSDSILGSVIKKLALFKDFGLGGILPMLAPLGVFANLLATLIIPLTSLIGLITILKAPFTLFQKLLSSSNPIIKFMLKPIELLKSGIISLIRLAFTPLMASLRALTLAFAVTPIGPMVAGVLALGAALAGIIYYWDDIKKGASAAFTWITESLGKVADSIAEFFGVESVWKSFKDGFSDAMNWIIKVWTEFKQKYLDFGISGVLGKLGDALGIGISETKQVVSPTSNALGLDTSETKQVVSPTSNTLGLGASETKQVVSTVSQEMPTMTTMQQQPGVVASPSFTDYSKVTRETSSDPNIQALINEVSRLQEIMAKVGEAITNRPLVVQIEGDVKKLFRAISAEQKNQLGSRMAGGAF